MIFHGDWWYMHKPESVIENENYSILWVFTIQLNHSIPSKTPDIVLIYKKKERPLMGFAVTSDHKVKIEESKKIDKYLVLVRGKKLVEHAYHGNNNCAL